VGHSIYSPLLALSTSTALLISLPGMAHPQLVQRTPTPPSTYTQSGVLTFEHGASALNNAPRITMSQRPIAVIGGADGDSKFDLTRVAGVSVLVNGSVAGFSSAEGQLFMWQPGRQDPTVFGRPGRGPGEYVRVWGVSRGLADTLLLFDGATQRLDLIVRGSALARSSSLAGRLPPGAEVVLGQLSKGRVVYFSPGTLRAGVPGRIIRSQALVTLVSAEGPGRQVVVLDDLEVAMQELTLAGQTRRTPVPLGFSRAAQVVVWDTLLATTSQDRYQVDIRNAEGKVLSRLLVRQPRRVVTTKMRNAAIDQELAGLRATIREPLRDPAGSERTRRQQPYADSLPPMGRMHSAPDGTLWVMDYLAPGDASWFATAFRLDGVILGRMTGRTDPTPIAFGADRVVLRSEDQDGIVTFLVHAFPRPQPAGR